MRLNYAIVFVSDMKRAVSFYRDVLGLPLRFDSPGWTEFATEGATLALHLARGTQDWRKRWTIDSTRTLPARFQRSGPRRIPPASD